MTSRRETRVLPEAEAVTRVEDGMTVALGMPPPMHLVRQLVRRRVRNLTIVDGGVALDLLIAAGCVRRSVTYYAGGGFGIPVLPSFQSALEEGTLSVFDCDEGMLMAGLQAAAQGLPFMPWRAGIGTSLPDINPALKPFCDPLAGEALLAIPPIAPDVALLHAASADEFGNVRHIGGAGWADAALHRAAGQTIVQVERIVPNEAIRAEPSSTTLVADAVVVAPYGAHPFASRGFYVQDNAHLQDYLRAAATAAAGQRGLLARYLEEHCDQPVDSIAYLERIGIRRLLALHED